MFVFAAKAQEAAGVLEVSLEGLTSDMVSKAYRQKAKGCHPDHHGNSKLSDWSRVSWAKECLDRWLDQNPEQVSKEIAGEGNCRACDGTGRVKVASSRSFGPKLTMMCVICEGTGSVALKENDSDYA